MIKRLGGALVALMVASGATVTVATTAGAAPPGAKGDAYVCDGEDVVVFGGSGRSGWLGDTLYQATDAHFTGTFTPTEGDPETFSFDKVWGKGPGGEPVTCTQHIDESDDTGTFVGDSVIHAVKVPGH